MAADCPNCGIENMVVPAEQPPADEGGTIPYVCLNCGESPLNPSSVAQPFYGSR